MKNILFILVGFLLFSCKKDELITEDNSSPGDASSYYFPDLNSTAWESQNINDLNWSSTDTTELFNHLSQNGTRAFIILHKGKIVIEKYWGNNIQNNAPFDKNSNWYWASAGKTITAFLTGIAQEEGLININDKTSDYLGENWTSAPLEKENLITIKHQLTMTTGLDYNASSHDCTSPSCLQYKVDAGDQWYYYNAPYTLLESVISNASGLSYNDFTYQKLSSKIGMNGQWVPVSGKVVYLSTARDAARFGLLLLNKGKWSTTTIMQDQNYFNAMTNTSQSLNPSYGYLFWLNGKTSIVLPSFPGSFNQPLSQHAPIDLYAGIGKNGQYLTIVPSRDLVVIRMGEAPDTSLVPTVFHDEMWEKINALIN